jgi:uncharacterized protein
MSELSEAVGDVDIDLVRRLLASGANPNEMDPFDGWTLLHYAVDREADAYAQDGVSDRPGHPPSAILVKLLLEAGADPNLADKQGRTALDIAARMDYHPAAAAILRQFGARSGEDLAS